MTGKKQYFRSGISRLIALLTVFVLVVTAFVMNVGTATAYAETVKAPTNVKVVETGESTATDCKFRVSWEQPDDNRVRGYDVYLKTDGEDYSKKNGYLIDTNGKRFDIRGLSTGTRYYVQIEAVGLEGYSPARSEEVMFYSKFQRKIEHCTVTNIADQTYTGSEIKPEPTLTFYDGNSTTTLEKDVDYTVSYSDNKEAGTASVTFTGKNNYVGTLTKEFKIVKIKVNLPTATMGLVYNGSVQTGVKLPADAPYTLTGNTATNAGYYTATATLKDKDKYEWNLATPTSSDQKINWCIQSCTINVKADNKTTNLYEELDALTFTTNISYGASFFSGKLATDADKTKAGTYKITKGTLSAGSNYYINFTDGTYTVADPDAATRFFVSGKAYKKSIKYSWSAVPNAAKYKVYFAKCGSKKYKRVTTTTAITYTKKKLAGKTAYKAYVEAYDAEGKLIAKAPVVVLATTGSSKANATAVTADAELSVALGESVKVSAKVSAKDSKKALRWKGHFSKSIRYYSSDSSIATVDKSGKVTGVARGVVNIYSVAPSGVSAVTKVRVLK